MAMICLRARAFIDRLRPNKASSRDTPYCRATSRAVTSAPDARKPRMTRTARLTALRSPTDPPVEWLHELAAYSRLSVARSSDHGLRRHHESAVRSCILRGYQASMGPRNSRQGRCRWSLFASLVDTDPVPLYVT